MNLVNFAPRFRVCCACHGIHVPARPYVCQLVLSLSSGFLGGSAEHLLLTLSVQPIIFFRSQMVAFDWHSVVFFAKIKKAMNGRKMDEGMDVMFPGR